MLHMFVLALGLAQALPNIHTPGRFHMDDTTVTVIDLSPKQGVLSDLLKTESAKALKEGRTPFVEIGAEWCGQCRELKASLGDKRMIEAFAGTYIIRLDLDAWKQQLPALGLDAAAVPTFFAIDSIGKSTGASFTTDPLGAHTPENVATPLRKFFRQHLREKAP